MANHFWKIILIILAGLILAIVGYYLLTRETAKTNIQTNIPAASISASPDYSAIPAVSVSLMASPDPIVNADNQYVYPIAEFQERITKKPFGIYINPETSPIQPERFSGYHNAVDVEYEDVSGDVPVYALADGTIVYSGYVSGYGGMFILEFDYNGAKHNALYGHIRPASLPSVSTTFSKGQQIAVLGTGYSSETDGERRHLHFGILSDNRIDLRGYVQSESELSEWINPLDLYK